MSESECMCKSPFHQCLSIPLSCFFVLLQRVDLKIITFVIDLTSVLLLTQIY